MQRYITYFFIYAVIGWIMEVSFHVMTQGKFINRGFLNGPYCPIYGFGALGVLGLLGDLGVDNKFMLFFVSMFVSTILEFIAGFLLEKLFHKRWWDYSGDKFNIAGYISLKFSLMWGAICFILYEAVHPPIRHLVIAIPDRLLWINALIMGTILAIDLIATINTILGLNTKFKLIEHQSQDIRKVSDGIGQRVADSTARVIDKGRAIEHSPRFIEFDQRSEEFKARFDKLGERRILRAYPNLIKDLEDRWTEQKQNRE